jgi:biopolymer transport protein ExbB/TolQ
MSTDRLLLVRWVTLWSLVFNFAFIGTATSSIETMEQEMRSKCMALRRARTSQQQQRAGFHLSEMFVHKNRDYAELSVKEKERFVSFCLLNCDLDGEAAFNFLQLVVGRDRNRVVEGLERRLTRPRLIASGLSPKRVVEILDWVKRIKEFPTR